MKTPKHVQPLTVLFSVSALSLLGIILLKSETLSVNLASASTTGRELALSCSMPNWTESWRVAVTLHCPSRPSTDCECTLACSVMQSMGMSTPECARFFDGSTSTTSSQASSAKPVCGNSTLENKEQCDDGNKKSKDGCSASCKIESGYTCLGTTCTSLCGNGQKENSEKCDDGNKTPGDGCNASCKIESGYTCSNNVCTPKPKCGNGLKEGNEECDLGTYNGPKNQSDCSKSCKINR